MLRTLWALPLVVHTLSPPLPPADPLPQLPTPDDTKTEQTVPRESSVTFAQAAPQYSPDTPTLSPQSAAPDIDKAPSWFLRFSFGAMSTAPSEHKDLLELDGFSLGAKYALQLDGSFGLSPNLGLGLFCGLSYQSDRPASTSPKLRETVVFAGFQSPVSFSGKMGTFMVIPRIGFASADLNLGESRESKSVTGLAYGGEVAAFLREVPLGIAAGLLWAPTSPPGDLGRNYNAGGFYIVLSGVIHD